MHTKEGHTSVMPMANSEARTAALARRHYLAAMARRGGWQGPAAALVLVADGVACVGFAAALAGALGALPRGLHAAGPFLALGIIAACGRGTCTWTGGRLGAASSAQARAALRKRAMIACLGQNPAAAPQEGDMITIAVDGVDQTDGYLARFLPAQRAAGPVCLLVLAAAACASPASAAILAATLPPFTVLMILAGGAAADESRRQFVALARLSGLFADRVRCLPAILCFGAEDAQAQYLGAAAEDLRHHMLGVLRVAFISSAGLEFFAALSVALVAVYAGFNLLHLLPFPAPEHLTLPRAMFVLALAPEFYAPMRRLAAAYHDRQAAETAADRLMALEASARAPVPAAAQPAAPPQIRFAGATVRYAGEDRPALAPLTFTARPGGIVALLGPSGAGKSTALKLLLGLAPLSGGQVLIDGVDLARHDWSAAIAWMGQDPVLMPGTIAENIALACPGAAAADLLAAADRVGLCAALRVRPGGLATTLGERGGFLSGGERRRIALARALLKPAPILLLDEPTAHLDQAAEAALITAIRAACRGRTTLIATHAESLAAIADQIVHLEPAL